MDGLSVSGLNIMSSVATFDGSSHTTTAQLAQYGSWQTMRVSVHDDRIEIVQKAESLTYFSTFPGSKMPPKVRKLIFRPNGKTFDISEIEGTYRPPYQVEEAFSFPDSEG